MRKMLLPPIILLLFAACVDSSSIVTSSRVSPRFDVVESSGLSAAAGNGHVMPAAYASKMGEVNNARPHSTANMRYQQVFLGSELGGLERIDGLCLRHDEVTGGPQLTEQLTVKLGPTAMDNTNLSTSFDANYSSAPTQVFSGSVVIPATSGAGSLDSFDFCVEFDTEYVPPAGSNLIVEIINSSTSSSSHFKDACSVGSTGCTTRRVGALSATASTATFADNSGLVMSFITADPEAKADCTEERWMDFGFRNQGQCIRFVETGKDSRGE